MHYRACKGVTRAEEKRGSRRVFTGLLQGFVREKVYSAYRIRGLRSREINKITLVPFQATEALIAILTEPESPNGCSFTGSLKVLQDFTVILGDLIRASGRW